MACLAKVAGVLATDGHALSVQSPEAANALFDSVVDVAVKTIDDVLAAESGDAMEVDGEGPERSSHSDR